METMTSKSLIYALFLATALPVAAQAETLTPHRDRLVPNIVSYDFPPAAQPGAPHPSVPKTAPRKVSSAPGNPSPQGNTPTFQKTHLTVQQARNTYVKNAEMDGAHEGYQQKFAPSWLAQNHVSAKNAQVYEQQENNIANRDAIKAREDEMTNQARIAKNPRALAIQKNLDKMSRELESTAHHDENEVANQSQP